MIPIPAALWIGLAVAIVFSVIGALLVIWRGVAGGGPAITTLGALGISWAVAFGYHLPPISDANAWLPLAALASAVIFAFVAAVPGPRLQLRLAVSAGLSAARRIVFARSNAEIRRQVSNPRATASTARAKSGGPA